jgi:DNA polymerase
MSIRDFLIRHSLPPPPAIMPIMPDSDIPDPEIASEPCNEEENPESLHLEPFYWDVESRSAATLGKGKHGVGVHAYAEHASTSVLCVGYARGDGPVEIWIPGQPIPEVVLAAAADPYCDWVAHHAAFERSILEAILVPQHGWPIVPIERHVCTMTLALAHSHPGSLDDVAAILGLENQKDVATQREVAKMWKPRKPKRDEDPNKLYWVDSPELRVKLHLYCQKDTATMREAHQRLPPLLEAEREAAVIDAEINDTGVLIDTPLVIAASRLARQALVELDARIKQETDGAVSTASQTAKLKAWLVSHGVTLPRKQRKGKSGLQWKDSLDAGDIEKLLAEDLPKARVRSALEIRLQAAQSAANKVDRMLRTRCADGRVRNIYRMYGAVTGRWSGEGFQPQNLKRPELLQTDEAITEAIEAVLAGDYAGIKQRYGNVLGVVGDLCRSMLIPAPGHRFIVGDFTAIEARVLTFLAGDADKLESFRKFDCNQGRDIYCVTAEQVLGLSNVKSKSPERALGKIFELGLGYSMGGDKLLATIRKANLHGSEQITVEDSTGWVRKWRNQNPAIVEYWAALDATAMAAVRNPEMTIPCGAVQFGMRDGVLSLQLPSGRELKFPAPVIKPGRFGQHQISFIDMEAGRQRGKQMYGGKWAENVSSAVARDLLVEGMKRLRAAGYVLVLHTHDEIVAEMPIGKGSADDFKRLLTEVPAWARGLPVTAKVFECARFKKD